MQTEKEERPDFEKADPITFEQAKDKIAQDDGYKDFEDLRTKEPTKVVNFLLNATIKYYPDLSRERIEELETMVKTLKDAMIKGTTLASTLLFDDQELPPIEIARKRIEELEAALRSCHNTLIEYGAHPAIDDTVAQALFPYKNIEP